MSVIRKSDDLQEIVLRIFEDHLKFGGDFYIVSPWIHNFVFNETILRGLQIRSFGSEPSLYMILRVLSRTHPEQPLSIISHNFGMTPHSESILQADLRKFGIDRKDQINKLRIGDANRLYLNLRRRYKERSLFNDPWSSRYLKEMHDADDYREMVNDVTSRYVKVDDNIRYLRDLKKMLTVRNVKVGLQGNFHAKMLVAGSSCVTGSSNWTFSGFTRNDEINLFVSAHDSPDDFAKVEERCREIEKQSCPVNQDNVEFMVSLHQVLKSLYSVFFDWLTDNKRSIIRVSK